MIRNYALISLQQNQSTILTSSIPNTRLGSKKKKYTVALAFVLHLDWSSVCTYPWRVPLIPRVAKNALHKRKEGSLRTLLLKCVLTTAPHRGTTMMTTTAATTSSSVCVFGPLHLKPDGGCYGYMALGQGRFHEIVRLRRLATVKLSHVAVGSRHPRAMPLRHGDGEQPGGFCILRARCYDGDGWGASALRETQLCRHAAEMN